MECYEFTSDIILQDRYNLYVGQWKKDKSMIKKKKPL